MSKLSFQSFDMNCSEKADLGVGDSVQSVSMSYDGGRLIVSINGDTVLETDFAGNAFQVDIQ